MSEEAAVVNLFLTVRVGLVGTFLLFLPHITRKGLVFGTYVGEAQAEGEAVRVILRSWRIGCILLMAASLLVGWSISLAGWPVPGNLTGTAVLLGCAPLLYLRMYLKTRPLAVSSTTPGVRTSAAVLARDEARGEVFAKLALAGTLLGSVAVLGYAATSYESMPEQSATLGSLFGIVEEPPDKSLAAVLFLPLLNLVLSPAFAFMALLITHAKRSVRGGTGGRSAEAQEDFRLISSQLLAGMALFTCLFVAYLSVRLVHVSLGQAESPGLGLVVIALGLILYALVGLIQILRIHGQGGALREEGSVEAPLTGGLADNAHWFLGMLYVDREDPSILVESRFGIGYTMNLGNPTALLLLSAYLLSLAGLVVLGFAGGVS